MKTDRQLIERLLELQEHPEQATDEQLQQALDDPQMRELVEQMAFAKRTFKNEELQAEELDVEGEWEKFAADHYGEDNNGKTNFSLFALHSSLQKIAASFVGVLLVSGMAFAAIHIVRMVNSQKSQTVQTEQPMTAKASTTIPADTVKTDTIAPKIIRYDEATLQKILTDMGEYYCLRVELRNEDAKTLRLFFQWNQRQEASKVLEQLNTFERIHLVLNDSTIIAE